MNTKQVGLALLLSVPRQYIQGIIGIIQEYQKQGLLKDNAPLTTISASMGPIMIHQMFRHTNLNLPVPAIVPQVHVDVFLHGRRM